MRDETIQVCVEFAEKSGKILAALIREQPDCISTRAFVEYVQATTKIGRAIKVVPNQVRGSEIFEEYEELRKRMIRILMTEQDGE